MSARDQIRTIGRLRREAASHRQGCAKPRVDKGEIAPGIALDGRKLCRLQLLVLAAVIGGSLLAAARQAPGATSAKQLPNAPAASVAPAAPQHGETAAAGSAAISGTVLDPNGEEVQGAHVVLDSSAGAEIRSTQSGSNGEFSFAGLPPGSFKLAVSGHGWGTFVSPEIELRPGDFRLVPNIVLPLTTSSVVRVVANPQELAEEQVHIAEQQRVLGVFPNFYTSFDWNAPPLGRKQKFQLAFRSITDPVEFAGPAVIAGFEQQENVFPGYGGGVEGYAKRYGAAYANAVSAKLFANAVYPSLFHQDPRYFYKANGSFRSRMFYAISAAVMTRSDSGRWEPNYSYVLGTFTAGGLSNLYYPPANRGVALTFTNGAADIAADAGANLLREFVLDRLTSRGTNRPQRWP